MSRYLRTLVVLFSLLAASLWLPTPWTPPAAAEDGICYDTVTDQANLFEGKAAQVEEAMSRFDSIGAEAKAWTIPSLQGGENLEQYIEDTIVNNCTNLLNSSGNQMKGNLVIFAVSMEPRSLIIFYGNDFNSTLGGGASNRIQGDAMAPHLADGLYVDAFVDGADAVINAINGTTEPRPQENRPTNQTDTPAVSSNTLLLIGGALLGVIALVLVGFALYKAYALILTPFWKRRKEHQKLEKERMRLYTELGNGYVTLPSIESAMNINLAALKTWGLEKDAKRIYDEFAEMQMTVSDVNSRFTERVKKAKLEESIADLKKGLACVEDAKKLARQAEELANGITDQVKSANNFLSDLPSTLDVLRSRHSSMTKAGVEIEGLKEELAKTEAMLHRGPRSTEREQVDLQAALAPLVEKLSDMMIKTEDDVKRLANEPAKLIRELGTLMSEYAAFTKSKESDFARCHESMNQPANLLAEINVLQAQSGGDIRTASSRASKLKMLDGTKKLLASTAGNLAALRQRHRDMLVAERELPELRTSLHASIDQLQGYADSNFENFTAVEVKKVLSQYRQTLERIDESASVLRQSNSLSSLSSAVAGSLRQIQDDIQGIEIVRSAHAEALSTAKRRREAVKDFMDRHGNIVESRHTFKYDEAKRMLDGAQLGKASETDTFQRRVSRFNQKLLSAKDASSTFESLLRSLEQAKRRDDDNRRSHSSTFIYGGSGLGGGSSSSFGGSSFGGGSSSGFGGGGSFGGGSSSKF